MAPPPPFGTLEYFTSQNSFDGCCYIFIKTLYYDLLQTNGILNVNFHNINNTLTQDLSYFVHYNGCENWYFHISE